MASKTPTNKKLQPGEIIIAFGHKSGIGKTTVTRCCADLCEVTGHPWRGISVDRSERLPLRYPGKIVQVNLPTDAEGRLDPYAQTRAFGPIDGEIEKITQNGSTLLLDVGSGEYPHAVLDHAARSRLNSLLVRRGIRFTALIVTTTDSMVMSDVPRLVEAVQTALPSARIVVVLNERNGPFQFSDGSEAHKVWKGALEPVLQRCPSVTIPAMAPGCWDRFEDQGLRFSEVGLLDPEASEEAERQLIAWTRESRSLAIARHGDVAEWLHDAWTALSPIIAVQSGGEDNDA